MNTGTEKDVQYYLKQPYNVVIRPIIGESETYYAARVLEFKGCLAAGDTFQEAHEAIYEALEGFIEDMLENGEEVPLPVGDEDYSGNIRLRMPKGLHRDLSQAARLEDVSLNHYIVRKLSQRE